MESSEVLQWPSYIYLVLVIGAVLIYRFTETIIAIHIVYHYISIYANSEQ